MKNIFRLLFVVACLFTSTNPLLAQWVQTNTTNGFGNVTCFAVSGTNLFAGTNGKGVFLSTNNGASWTAVNTGIPTYYDYTFGTLQVTVQCLAVSGTNIFAGTETAGICLSTDNGTSWSQVNTGLTNPDVQALAVSPNGAGGTNIFAGTFEGGVCLSTDNGASWTSVSSGLTNLNIYAFAVSPNGAGGTNLFAGTDNDGAFLSSNNGTSWTSVGLAGGRVTCLAVSGTNLFAATFEGTGVFRSTNNGTSWTPVNTGLIDPSTGQPYTVSALTVFGSNIFAGDYDFGMGVFLSTNDGNS